MKKVAKKKTKAKAVSVEKHNKVVNELSRSITIACNDRDRARQWGREMNAEAYANAKKLALSETNVVNLIARVALEQEFSNEQIAALNAARTRITELLNILAAERKKKTFFSFLFEKKA